MSTINKPLSELVRGDVITITRRTTRQYVVHKVDTIPRSGRMRLWGQPVGGSWGRVTPANLGTHAPSIQFPVESE